MSFNSLLPLLIFLSAFIPGLCIFYLRNEQVRLRRILNLGGSVCCLVFIGLLIDGVYQGEVFETRMPLLPDIDLVFHADALSILFVSLSGLLWFLTTIYAIGYLQGSQNRSRFFGFFSLCVAATLGIALAGNLITFLIFYELLTITTYPLVVHKGNSASLRAGRIYLFYTLTGGALLLAGVVWLKALAGPLDFTATGVLSAIPGLDPNHLTIIFLLLTTGLGVKAALVPLHGWLPIAMAAPAPVSALLHAVAVVKAGAFGIVRVVYDVYGIEFARDLGLTLILGGAAAFTIVYGSVRAFFQNDIKKRLAYSTVSQVSYIALGTAIAGPIATIGGMVHLVHQGIMKITMFFCAGNFAETLGVHKVSEMNGIGRRMPLTMAAFTLAALGMIGVPPLAGFVSKWYLGTGALEVEAYWVLLVLAASSLLNAAYFLPLLHAAWFKPADQAWPAKQGILETNWKLLLPPLMTATLALLAGLFASAPISPINWAKLIAALEYGGEFVGATQLINLPNSPLVWVIITPMLLALGSLAKSTRAVCTRLSPYAAIPALLVALLLPLESTDLPGLFFGSVLAIDETSRVMLLLAASLWLVSGFYGRDYLAKDAHLERYTLFFLLCMSGSFGLTLSQDLFGFITFFTLMSFAAYGLVVHNGSSAAMQAGKTYMQWVVVGEVLLFSALVGLAITGYDKSLVGTDQPAQPLWVSWLLVLGFGIKAGLLTTHFWLPRAHPVAPVPASALLSGLMVKAGLLGWWNFLPLGQVTIHALGMVLITLGMSGAFLAVIAGLLQRNPKALLAYSTISQMGILAGGIGVGLMEPSLWPTLSLALLVYALHHGLAKAALFLAVGTAPRLASNAPFRWVTWLLVIIPALAMAGLPFTSGGLAKTALKVSVAELSWLTLLLSFTAIGTTLLMLQFVVLLQRSSRNANASSNVGLPGMIAFAALVVMVLVTSYLIPQSQAFYEESVTTKAFWNLLWPPLVGCLLYWLGKALKVNAVNSPIDKFIMSLRGGMKHLARITAGITTKLSDKSPASLQPVIPIRARFNVNSNGEWLTQIQSTQSNPGVVFVGVLLFFSLALIMGAWV